MDKMGSGKKIKVTHIRTSHGIFGAERVILGLLKSMDTTGFEIGVTLVGSEPGLNKDFADKIQRMGFKLRNFQLNGRLDLAGIKALRNYIKENNFDVVHCHDFKANFYGLMATLGTAVKRVTTVHGSTKDSFLLRLYLAFNEYILIRFFHKIIVVSDQLKNELKGKFFDSQKVRLIPNGVDSNFFEGSDDGNSGESDLAIPPGKVVVGTVGRLFPDKGHEVLFKALLILKDEFPNLILLIVGDGPHAEYLKALRDGMGLSNHLIFAGVRRNMSKIYKAFDIFVMPSIREGLPMALLEAMLSGVPVIATRVGGIPKILGEGERGRLVAPNDPDGLAKEIKSLLICPAEAKQMAFVAQAFVRSHYSAEVMARRTEALYKEILYNGMIEDREKWLEVLRSNNVFKNPEKWVDYARKNHFKKVRSERLDYCPDCGAASFSPVGQYIYYSTLIGLNICKNCNLIFSNTRIDPQIIQKHFEAVYKDEDYFVKTRRYIFSQISKLIDCYAPKKGRILDIGGGKGHLLSLVNRIRPDLKVVLNDISLESCRWAESKYHLDTICGHAADIAQIQYQAKYDEVIMVDVIYYEPKIPELWMSLSQIVKKEGTVIIRVPNSAFLVRCHQKIRGLIRTKIARELDTSVKFFNPESLFLFTKSYLRERLKNSGFRYVNFIPSAINIRREKLRYFYSLYFQLARVLQILSLNRIIITPSQIIVARKT